MRVQSLHIYPVKSCHGIDVSSVELDTRGFKHDRQWMVVSTHHGFLTQRQEPKMATIKPSLTEAELILSAPGMPDIRLPLTGVSPEVRQSTIVWNDTTDAADQGDDVAVWLSAYLGHPDLRLMRQCDDAVRVFAAKNGAPSGQIAFMDSRPFLMISTASLADLNARMGKPLPMNRFRPSIVIDDCKPYAEDHLAQVRVGTTLLHHAKLCTRCAITTVEQSNGEKDGKEPLKTLASYRKTESGVTFGCYFVHEGAGRITVGDKLALTY
jgi:uncharacterized protein YcbX